MYLLVPALCGMLYFALHITGSGSFPRPLSKEEEADCLRRMAEGDPTARTTLIEHNLRLVAHIVKKRESERQRATGKYGPGRWVPA